MDNEFKFGQYNVKISGRGLEYEPWLISGIDNPSAVATIEQLMIKNMMEKTGLDWFIVKTELLGIEEKKISKFTIGVKGLDKTRDFYFDVTEAFK
jgi:hypothetical protein